MSEKYCPMKFTASMQTRIDDIGFECDEEKCAWWDEAYKRCSHLVIGNSLRCILATLNRVVEELIKGGKL